MSLEKQSALKRAKDAIISEIKADCPDYLKCCRGPQDSLRVGFNHVVRKTDGLELGDQIDEETAVRLLKEDLERLDRNMESIFTIYWRDLRAPFKAALLELGQYTSARTIDQLRGGRVAIKERQPARIAEQLEIDPGMRRLATQPGMRRRIDRLREQLKSGLFIAVKAPKKKPVKATEANNKTLSKAFADAVNKVTKPKAVKAPKK